MKKLYEKPEIAFESFAVCTNIAAGCEFTTSLHGRGACGYQTRNGIVFMEDISGCKYHQPDNNDTLCYHNPNDLANIFVS